MAADEAAAALASDRMLTSVFTQWDLSFNGGLAEADLAQLLGMNASTQALHLRRLDLSYTAISDTFVLAVAAFAPNLEALRLDGCVKLTDAALCALGSLYPNLVELSVAKCAGITDRGVAAAVRALPLLQALDLSECAHVGGQAMKAVVTCCPLVRVLRLGGTAVDAATLSALFSYFLLEELDVSRLGVTDAHLERLVAKQPLLKTLNVSLCHALTRQGVEQFLGAAELRELRAFGLADSLGSLEDRRLLC